MNWLRSVVPFLRSREKAAESAQALAAQIPDGLVRLLNTDSREVGIFKAAIDTWVESGNVERKIALLKKYAEQIKAQAETMQVITNYKRTRAEMDGVDEELAAKARAAKRAETLAESNLQTQLARDDAERKKIARENEPPPVQPPPAAESFRTRADRILAELHVTIGRTTKKETTKQARKEIVTHTFMARIVAAEQIDGDKDLAEELRHEMEKLIGDIETEGA